MKTHILSCLSDIYPWTDQLHYYDTIDSTNDCLKNLARNGAPHGTAVIAGHQTNGHGRRGRSFYSPQGKGIYLSLLLRPECPPVELMHLTCATAVAMCDAVKKATGICPGIKWTNDLVFEKKKLGGILTELALTPSGMVAYAIIGVGINVSHESGDFPEEIREIAASLDMVSGKQTDTAALAASMLEALCRMDSSLISDKASILEHYRRNCITIGQEISLVRGEDIRYGRALSVDEEGALVVEFSDGSVEAVNSGEVSVRGMYGYVS